MQNYLVALLREKGFISFAEFMHQVLYAPNLGYYSAGSQKFGAQGDFVTAPELTPLFGYALANQCATVLQHMDKPEVLEFGAGTGRLCVTLLQQLERLNALPQAYHILEVSGSLQQRQRALVATEIPHLASRVTWLTQWPEQPFMGVVLANEVLDAMPVHRFLQTEQQLLESHIGLTEAGALCEHWQPCTNAQLTAYVQQVVPPDYFPYQSEANLLIPGWLEECAMRLEQGLVLLLDYGFPRHEYYHRDRDQGTLMCHYRHHAHSNPFVNLGDQDITAHVDFTLVAESAVAAGFHVAGYTNQAAFLLSNGLLDFVAGIADTREQFRAQQAVKQLVQPEQMGELVKVIALTKRWDLPLTGFALQDKRESL